MSVYKALGYWQKHDFYKNKHNSENKKLHYQLGDLDLLEIRGNFSFMPIRYNKRNE